MVQTVQAQIVSITRLNDTIWQYLLQPTEFVPYQAGQYLQIQRPEGEHYFSIANAPSPGQYYELHVRHRAPEQQWSLHSVVNVSLPYGVCDVSHLHPEKPIIFLAAGTGFAPIRAMIEQLLLQSDPRYLELHWQVTVASDWYDQQALRNWQDKKPNLHYFTHLSPVNSPNLMPVIIEKYPQLKNWQIVMAGPFELMFAMQKELLDHGLSKEVIFSDAFEFA